MAKPTRTVEAPHYFDRFYSGLFTNRNPLYTPKRIVGMSVVPQNDILIDGLNMEITPQQTLARRPGLPNFCSVAFGVSEWPLATYSCRLQGVLYNFVDTQVAIYLFTASSLTLLYTKTTTGRSFFQQVGDILFWSDGTVNLKWDGTDITKGAVVTNNGVAAPTAAPIVSNLNFHDISGHVQYPHAWSPNYAYTGPSSGANTYWFLDPNGNIEFAFQNVNGTGASSNSAPKWPVYTTDANGNTVSSFGDRTVDGTMLWTSAGQVGVWQAAKGSNVYSYTAFNSQNLPTITAGPKTPTFPYDRTDSSGQVGWTNNALGANLRTAAANNATKTSNVIKFKGFGFNLPGGAVITGIKADLQRVGFYENSSTGSVTDLVVKLLDNTGAVTGSNKAATGAWPSYHAQPLGSTQTYGGSADLWGGSFGPSDINSANFGFALSTTNKSLSNADVQSVLIGLKITVYYQVSSISGTFFSSVILDSNGNLQRVSTLGTTGGSQPAWNAQIGGTTTDNTMVWECMGSGNLLAALLGWDYAYSFHTKSAHTSTLGPQLTLAAPIIGPSIPLSGVGSDDTQVDSVDTYRNYDGGSLFYYDFSENNVNSSTSWNHIDTALDTDLNTELVGPIADANDPPFAGMTILAYHMGRMWGAKDKALYFSAGPDCTNGDPNQAWPPANVFQFPDTITATVPTAVGLLVFTQSHLWAILGGPQTLSFYAKPLKAKFGVLSPNCVVDDGSTVYCYTSNRQLLSFDISGGKEEPGFSIADKLRAAFDPASSFLTVHRNGEDEGLFICNGTDSMYRTSLNGGAWSLLSQPVGGVGLLNSIETTAGVYTLLAGRPSGSGKILGRSTTTFTDGTSSIYSGYATFGSIVFSGPATDPLSIANFVLQYTTAGTDLTVGVLPNEIGGAFTNVPFTVNDPFYLPASSTIKMRRYDWLGIQSQLTNQIRHLQLKVTLPTEAAKNELLGLAITPAANV